MFQGLNRWNRSFSKSADSLDQLEKSSSTPMNRKRDLKPKATMHSQTRKYEDTNRSASDVPSDPIEIQSPQINKRILRRNSPEKVNNRNKTLQQILQFGYSHIFKNASSDWIPNQSSSSDEVDTLAFRMTTTFFSESEASARIKIDIHKKIALSSDRLRLRSPNKLPFSASSSYYTNQRERTERTPTSFLPVLPPDYSRIPKLLLLKIFCLLDVNDLISCSLVCKSWNSVEKDDTLWKQLYENCKGTLKDRVEALLGQIGHCNVHKSFKHRYALLTKRRRSVTSLSKPAVQHFTFEELEKDGVLVSTKIPTFSRSAVTFWFVDTHPGEFILIIQYGRVPMELKYKVSELIEMYVNGIECIDDDIVVWSAKNLLHFLNVHNIGLHEVPSSFVDSNQPSNNSTENLGISFDFNNNNNRRYSL